MLYLNLFGTPEIYLDNLPALHFRTRKAKALLLYLAVTERSWSRDMLATLFWPETDDTSARKNLRDILPPLRRQLGDYLLLDSDAIGLSVVKPHFCDVTTFSQVLERPLTAIGTHQLVDALALYRGEFLEGFATSQISPDFELWVVRERKRLQQLALMGFTTLCRLQQESSAYEDALGTNRQLLKLAPWDEAAHQQQMLLLAQSGQQAAALAYFDTCRQILAEELDTEPAPETIALYQQIRSGAHQPVAHGMSALQAPHQDHADQTPTRTDIPHNLPTALTALIGYAEELNYIQTQFIDNNCRLLTLTGMGGVGKTHLALESARRILKAPRAHTRFTDGVFFVALDGIREASTADAAELAIASAIAHVLGHTFSGGASPQQQLQAALANKKMLLILDNIEHLVEGAQLIAALLQGAGAVTILATSREKLNLRGEYLLELRGLLPQLTNPSASKSALPEDVVRDSARTERTEETLVPNAQRLIRENDAVALFAYYAQMSDHHFYIDEANITHIVQICELLDGLPLGIEMAAKWLDALDCSAIAAEIAQNLDFLAATRRDMPNRHQTLRAVFDHSWRLLDSAEQTILAHLAIFQPNFPLAAALAVAEASPRDLMLLNRKSLLLRNADGSFTIHRSIRRFAREKLSQDERKVHAVEKRYAAFYLDLLAKFSLTTTSAESSPIESALLKDSANVYSALRVAIKNHLWAEIRAATRGVAALFDAYGWFLEGVDLCTLAAKQLTDDPPSVSYIEQQILDALLGYFLAYQGWFECRLGHFVAALSLFQRSLPLLRSVRANIDAFDNGMAENDIAIDAALYAKQTLGSALSLWGWLELIRGQPQPAMALFRESIPLVQGLRHHSIALCGLAFAMYQLGDYQEAKLCAQVALTRARQDGVRYYEMYAVSMLGRIEQVQGRYAAAEQLYLQCYELRKATTEQTGLAFSLRDLGDITRLQGNYDASADYLRRGLALATAINSNLGCMQLQWTLGNLALQQGDFKLAMAHFGESQNIQQINHLSIGLPTLGWGHFALAEFAEAEHYFLDVVRALEPFGAYGHLAEALAGLILLQHIAGEEMESAQYLPLIENHPATTQETKDRVRRMHARAEDAAFAVHRKAYHPSSELGPTVARLIDRLQHWYSL